MVLGKRLALAATAAVTAAYLVLELSYNGTLLSLAADPAADAERMKALSWVGKGLASWGVAWALLRPVAARSASTLPGKATAFLVAWLCVFGAVDFGYRAAISSLPEDVKLAGRSVAAWRASVLKGDGKDAFLAPVGKPDRVAAVSAAFLLADPASASRLAEFDVARAKADGNRIDRGSDRLLKGYLDAQSELRKGYELFVQASMAYENATTRKNSREGALASAAIWFGYTGAKEFFTKKTGGLSPDVDATYERFVSEILPKSKNPKVKAALKDYTAKAVPMPDGTRIAAADMPQGMDEAAARDWVDTHVRGPWKAVAGADLEGWLARNESKDALASVFVPPVSMALSQVSVALNLAALLAMLWTLSGSGKGGARIAMAVAVLGVCGSVLSLSPASAWPKGSEGRKVEASAKAAMGVWGDAWARSAAVQRLMERSGISTGVDVTKLAGN